MNEAAQSLQKTAASGMHQMQGMASGMTAAATKALEGAPKVQTVCPVMGGVINKDLYVDYKGKRIYFCCPDCPPVEVNTTAVRSTVLAPEEGSCGLLASSWIVAASTPAAASNSRAENRPGITSSSWRRMDTP